MMDRFRKAEEGQEKETEGKEEKKAMRKETCRCKWEERKAGNKRWRGRGREGRRGGGGWK